MTRSVNWQDLLDQLAPLRRRWDMPVLVSLANGRMRPADLIKVINSHDSTGREMTWEVLTNALRRLEARRLRRAAAGPGRAPADLVLAAPGRPPTGRALTGLENWLSSHDSQDATLTTEPGGGQEEFTAAAKPGKP